MREVNINFFMELTMAGQGAWSSGADMTMPNKSADFGDE